MLDDSKFPCRRTDRLHNYACYYFKADAEKAAWMFCESMNQYSPGERVPAADGIGYFMIEFEL